MTDPDRTSDARAMVDALPVRDSRIRSAMLAVPRHQFVPQSGQAEAYDDEPVSLGVPQATASAPSMVALQLEAAQVRPGDHVLEIGAGMGYLAALLAELVGPTGRVDAVEVDPFLAGEARRRLAEWAPPGRVHVHARDGAGGFPEAAPFDRIIVSCQTGSILEPWREQLAPGGRIVAPVGDTFEQVLTTVVRSAGGWTRHEGTACRFVALRRRLPRDI